MPNSLPRECIATKKGLYELPYGDNMLVYLIKQYNLKSVAEVGVFTGNLTSRVLSSCEGIEEYHCIDPWKPYPESYDREPREEELTEEYWNNIYQRVVGISKKYSCVKIHRCSSLEGIERFDNGSLDIVYIDAIHDYENGKADLEGWRPKIKDGGFLCGHDYAPRFRGLIEAIDEFCGRELNVLKDSNWFLKV